VEAVLVGFPGIAPHYQIVLTRDGALDAMIVEVELAPEFAGDRLQSRRSDAPHQVDDRRDLQGRDQGGR
jgi:phenylacetate-CoA ligase